MTLREKVGQLLMVGFDGTELSSEFTAWLKDYRPGGIILFSRNLVDPLQIAQLTTSLQELTSGEPLLIAIDQEGGRVSRLPKDFTIFPPAARVAGCHSPELTYQTAAITARELRAVGINMNMAPILDINTNPSNPIIGDRAYGQDPDQVCKMGTAIISGLHDEGVVACGKHFPGHGETTTDSHKELPVVNLSKERLEHTELKPFGYAIAHGLQAMMSAHVHFPALDATTPATLSHAVMTDLLRGRLGFTGLSLSDDLEMNAIVDHSSVGDAAVRCLQAGIDILLICHRQDRQAEACEAVERALTSGDLSMQQIEASLKRLSEIKQRFLNPYRPVDLTAIPNTVGCPTHRELLHKIQALSPTP